MEPDRAYKDGLTRLGAIHLSILVGNRGLEDSPGTYVFTYCGVLLDNPSSDSWRPASEPLSQDATCVECLSEARRLGDRLPGRAPPRHHLVRRLRVVDGEVRVCMSPAELKLALDRCGEYSCSNPSGTYEGKFWLRRGQHDEWWLCQYLPDEEPGYMRVKRWLIHVELYEDGIRRLDAYPLV